MSSVTCCYVTPSVLSPRACYLLSQAIVTHFWALSSRLSTTPKRREKRSSANWGIRPYPYITSALLGSDMCNKAALAPNKVQICSTISWHLIYVYTEIGWHWKVLCQCCDNSIHEGEEGCSGHGMFLSCNKYKLDSTGNHTWLGSIIPHGLSLCCSPRKVSPAAQTRKVLSPVLWIHTRLV